MGTGGKLCKSTAMSLILFKLWRGINLQFFSACYLSYSFLVSVFKLGMWSFPFRYVVRKTEEKEKVTQSSNALQCALWMSHPGE